MSPMYTWEHIPGGLHVPSPGHNGQYGGLSGSECVSRPVPSPLGFMLLACPLEGPIVQEWGSRSREAGFVGKEWRPAL